MAGSEHPKYALFSKFADWHWSRVAPVFIAVGGKGVLQRLDFHHLPGAITAVQRLAQYLESEQASLDSLETRRERIRPHFKIVFDVLGGGSETEVVDAFVEMVAKIEPGEATGSSPEDVHLSEANNPVGERSTRLRGP
jgi:hypothetical protein